MHSATSKAPPTLPQPPETIMPQNLLKFAKFLWLQKAPFFLNMIPTSGYWYQLYELLPCTHVTNLINLTLSAASPNTSYESDKTTHRIQSTPHTTP